MRWFRVSNASALVADLGTATARRREVVGGKAASLSLMMGAALPVPPGFCITVEAFEAFLDSCPNRANMRHLLSRAGALRPDQATGISRQLVARLADLPVPPPVAEAVLGQWRKRGELHSWAVRSSATVEDATAHSFAGLFESVLNVHGSAALLAGIKRCWLSLFSARSLAYHARNGFPLARSAMAVVVQEMVAADAAGVLFTVDPVTGETTRIVIEASAGLGDRVAGGRVAPEQVVLDKASFRIITRSRPSQAAGDATVLDGSTAAELAKLSRRLEACLRGPLDIEWAVCKGVIHLLQARPAADRSILNVPTDRQIWTNANSGEAAPEPLTPMTDSFLMAFLRGLFDNLLGRWGLRIRPDEMISLIAGRPYFNLNLGAALLNRLPGVKPEDIRDVFGGAHETLLRKGLIRLEAGDLPRLKFHAWQALCGLPPTLLDLARFLALKDHRAAPGWRHSPEAPVAAALREYSDAALLEQVRAAVLNEQIGHDSSLRFMAIGALWVIIFFTLSKRWFGAEGLAMASRLTAGLGTVDPAEAARELWRLAQLARQHPAVRSAVDEEREFTTLERRLSPLGEGRAFLEQWRAVLARHGHHARGELELMNQRWHETPNLVLDLVRHYLEAADLNSPVAAACLPELARQRAALERECLRRLKTPWSRKLFRWSLGRARLGVAVKENARSGVVQSLFHARLRLLELGRRLAERGRLSERDDIFFLRLEELAPEFLFEGDFALAEVTAPRRSEYERNRNLHPPPVVFGSGDLTAWQDESGIEPVDRLDGLAVSPGVAVGRARVILEPDGSDRVMPGEILVAPSTDPAWSPYFLTASGIAIDLGGVLSHGSILAREYGLPAVTNLGFASRIIRSGDLVQVDGNHGRVTILERANGAAKSEPGVVVPERD